MEEVDAPLQAISMARHDTAPDPQGPALPISPETSEHFQEMADRVGGPRAAGAGAAEAGAADDTPKTMQVQVFQLDTSYVLELRFICRHNPFFELVAELKTLMRPFLKRCWPVVRDESGWRADEHISTADYDYPDRIRENAWMESERVLKPDTYFDIRNDLSHECPPGDTFSESQRNSRSSGQSDCSWNSIHEASGELARQRVPSVNSAVREQKAHLISAADNRATDRVFLDGMNENFLSLPAELHCMFDGRQLTEQQKWHSGKKHHPGSIAFFLDKVNPIAKSVDGNDMIEFHMRIVCRNASAAEDVRTHLYGAGMTKPIVKEIGVFGGLYSVEAPHPVSVPVSRVDKSAHKHEPAPPRPTTPLIEPWTEQRVPDSHFLVVNHSEEGVWTHDEFQRCVWESFPMRAGSWNHTSVFARLLRSKSKLGPDPDLHHTSHSKGKRAIGEEATRRKQR